MNKLFGRRRKDEKEKEEEKKQHEMDSSDDWRTDSVYRDEASEDGLTITIDEKINGKFSRDWDILNIDKKGYFSVQNLGEEDVLFDVDVALENVDYFDEFDDHLYINDLNPQELFEQSYAVKEVEKEDLPFIFKETINTAAEEDETSSVLVYGHRAIADITLEFDFERSINEIHLVKDLPSGMENIDISSTSLGESRTEDGKVYWDIADVDADTFATLVIRGEYDVQEIDKKPTGNITITYSGEGKGSTLLSVTGADAFVRTRIWIDSDEEEEKPNMWDSSLIIENTSEFPIELRQIEISFEDEKIIEEYFEANEIIIESGQKWKSEIWQTESEDLPHFKKVEGYTVKPEIIAKISGDVQVEETELSVAYATGEKSYSETKFASFRNSPVDVTTTVTNKGSVGFEELTIRDHLAEYFAPPEFEEVNVIHIKEDGSETELDPDDYELSIEPSGADIDKKKYLVCTISQLIEPNDQIHLKYTSILTGPPAEMEFETEPMAHATLVEPAPTLDIPIEDTILEFNIVHVRRRYTAFKDVTPMEEEGMYQVMLYYKNRSNTKLEDVSIKDLIPSGFELMDVEVNIPETEEEEVTIESEVIDTIDEGEIREWVIPTIEEEQEVEITYTVKGEGEYKGKDLLISH